MIVAFGGTWELFLLLVRWHQEEGELEETRIVTRAGTGALACIPMIG